MTEPNLSLWLPLISLVVALVGGVPGVVTVLRERKARPRFAAYLRQISPICVNDASGHPRVGLILQVAIGNEGQEAIVPLAFQLECKIRGKWRSFEAGSIPEGFTVTGPEGIRTYTNVFENDIHQRQKGLS